MYVIKKIRYLLLIFLLNPYCSVYPMKVSDTETDLKSLEISISDTDFDGPEYSDHDVDTPEVDQAIPCIGSITIKVNSSDYDDANDSTYMASSIQSSNNYHNESSQLWHEHARDNAIDNQQEGMRMHQEAARHPITDFSNEQSQGKQSQLHRSNIQSSQPLTDTIQDINRKLQSDTYRQQLETLKNNLDEKIEHAWPWQKNELEKQQNFIDHLLDGTVPELLHTIQHGNLKNASHALRTLGALWPWGNHFQDPNKKEQRFACDIGTNIMKKAESCFVLRQDFLSYFHAQQAIQKATATYRAVQAQGKMKALLKEKKYLIKQLKKCDHRDASLLRAQLALVKSFLHAPATQILSTIVNEDLAIAKAELDHLGAQLHSQVTEEGFDCVEAARDYLIEELGFDLVETAQTLYESRSDYQETAGQYNFIPIDVQQDIIAALTSEQNHEAVIAEISDIKDRVFDNAYNCQYEIPYKVESQVEASINTLRATKDSGEIAFHVAMLDRLLGDMHAQTALQMAQESTLLERSPQLLVHALETYITHLNPITQVKGICEFWVSTAHYVCDVTLGKMYLSKEQYQQRIDSFWNTIDALSPENLAQLSAEQWVDLAAQFAADVTFGMGLGKTIKYLKNIDAIAKTQRQAARIAQRFKNAIDNGLAKVPLLITPEGIPLRVPFAQLEHFDTTAKDFFYNTKELLKSKKETIKSALQIKPLDYGHSAIQYQKLKELLRIEEFTSVIKCTKHGLERILERGFTPEEVLSLVTKPDYVRIQSDGAKAFIKKVAENKHLFMVYNEAKMSVVTAIRHISKKDLINLAKNYGWKL